MKKHFLLFIITAFFLSTAIGQSDKEEIKNTFEDYFHLVEKGEYLKSMDYIYPKLFEKIPRKMLEEAMLSAFSDTSTKITMTDAKLIDIAKIITVEGIQYSLVTYSFVMGMTMEIEEDEEEEGETEEEDEIDTEEFMLSVFNMQFGEENVKYDREAHRVDIHKDNKLFAIQDPANPGWKFLEKKENQTEILKELFPQKVLKKLK